MIRKTLLLIIVLVLTAITNVAAETYEVVCSSNLNVRQTASKSSRKIGTIPNGSYVEVVCINGQWAEIQYQGGRGYVSASYIQKVEIQNDLDSSSASKSSKFKSWINNKDFDFKVLGDTTIVLVFLLPAFIFLYFFNKRKENKNYWRDVCILSIVVLVMSVLEIVYAMGSQDFTWFCSEPRWYWIVVNFILFAVCTYQQLLAYLRVLISVSNGKDKFSLWSWPICIVLCIILYFCHIDQIYAIGVLILAQLIQAGIIFYEMAREKNVLIAIACSLIYLVSTIATAIMLIQFLALLIIVIIGCIVLMALSHGNSTSRRSSDEEHYETPSTSGCSSDEEHYETPDGYRLHYDGFGKWHDERGRHYENTNSWGGREMRRTDDD